jgi:hypothetical protein
MVQKMVKMRGKKSQQQLSGSTCTYACGYLPKENKQLIKVPESYCTVTPRGAEQLLHDLRNIPHEQAPPTVSKARIPQAEKKSPLAIPVILGEEDSISRVFIAVGGIPAR